MLGNTALPYTVTSIPRPFASIQSNLPGIVTGNPSIIMNRYGKGKVVYSTAAFANMEAHDQPFADLIRFLAEDIFQSIPMHPGR